MTSTLTRSVHDDLVINHIVVIVTKENNNHTNNHTIHDNGVDNYDEPGSFSVWRGSFSESSESSESSEEVGDRQSSIGQGNGTCPHPLVRL